MNNYFLNSKEFQKFFSLIIISCTILFLMECNIIYAQDDCDDDDGGSESSKFAQGCDECYSGSSISEILVVTSEGIQVRNTEGKLIKTFITGYGNIPSGMSANAEGKLFISDLSSREVSVFDKNGNLTGSFRSGSDLPGEIVADKMSNVYISEYEGSEIKKFDLHGNYLTSFYSKEKIKLIALHPDNCTMFYTSDKGDLLSFNLCANTSQELSFPPGILKKANSFKIYSDGSILAAVGDDIIRLSPEGKLIQSYDVLSHDHWSALGIDTDGESFWCADYCNSNVRRFDILTGEEISYFSTGTGPGIVYGLVIKKADESDIKVSESNVTLELKISPESLESIPVKGESITVSLRKSSPPYQIIDYKKGVLDADGNCSPLGFSNVVLGNSYYIAVRKKNSIETWSESITISELNIVHELTTKIYSGDLNQDGFVDGTDLSLLSNTVNTSAESDKAIENDKNEIFDFEQTVRDNAFNFATTNKPEGVQASPIIEDNPVNVTSKQTEFNSIMEGTCDELNKNSNINSNKVRSKQF